MKRQPFFKHKMKPAHIEEWKAREYNSYEDSDNDEGHVYNIISRSITYVSADDKAEAEKLLKSAKYCSTWNNGDPFADRVDASIAKCAEKLIETLQ